MKNQTIWKRLFNCLLSCVVACATVFALAASPHHGVVTFGGLPVPGATVTVTQGDKKLVAVTDQQGAYSFPDLADGIWKIQVEMLCFAPINQEIGITPEAPSPVWELKLLSLDEIKASAPPPAPKPAAPATTATSAAPAAAAAATPSTQPAATPSITAANDAANAAATNNKKKPAKGKAAAPVVPGGFQRTDLNASSDASAAAGSAAASPGVGELNSGGAAEALSVGGSTSNGIESRAIGNNRRGPGSLYSIGLMTNLDSSYLDARPFSQTGQNIAKEPYEHLHGAASVQGPLRIPHLWHSNNGQFFLSYQWGRQHTDSTSQGLVPTQAERNGDFSQVLNNLGQPVTIIDPATITTLNPTGSQFPNNIIPQKRISSQAMALLQYYPLPNFNPTASINYEVPAVSIANTDNVQSRVNKMINTKNFLFGAYNYQNNRGVNVSPNLFGFTDNNASTGMNANANWRRMISQRLNISSSITASRFVTHAYPYFENPDSPVYTVTAGNDQDPLYRGPPTLAFSSGINALSDGLPSYTANQTVQGSTAVQWTHRPHEFQFGADIRRQEFNSLSQQNPRGQYSFTGAATQQQQIVNGVAVPLPGTGSDFADFLLGTPDVASLAFGNADKYFRSNFDDAYFNDNWRIASGLTITGGVRWEYGSPITELQGRLVNLDIASGYSAVAPVEGYDTLGPLTGQKYPDSLVRPDKHGFEPRLGIAWRPIFGSSLLVRAGYGINYNTSVYQTIANQMAQQSPLSKSFSIANSPATPLTLADGLDATPAGTPNTFAINPNFLIGYVQTWNAVIQRDLPGGMLMYVTYLGNKGTRGAQEFYPNTYPEGGVSPCPACPSNYAYLTSNGNSTRESGTFQLRRRLHNGITASAQYTYSKSIDDAVLGGKGQGGSLVAQNWLDLSAERGLSNFDQRHLATFSAQYTSGMGMHGGTLLSGWRGAAFKGWTLLTNISVGSGLPETPTDSALKVGGASFPGSIRPEYTGASLYAALPGLFLNPAAYTAPLAGDWGDAGRNSIIGPSQFSLSGSLQRSFGKFDFRLDSANTLNHVVFSSWIANIANSQQFGLPTLGSANTMRTVTATLRWRF
jgi:trimeric autotransporter adhesin